MLSICVFVIMGNKVFTYLLTYVCTQLQPVDILLIYSVIYIPVDIFRECAFRSVVPETRQMLLVKYNDDILSESNTSTIFIRCHTVFPFPSRTVYINVYSRLTDRTMLEQSANLPYTSVRLELSK